MDILLAVPNQINEILNRFNSYHNRLRFTVEHGDDKSINFLDVKVILEDSYIEFDIYKKLTNSRRYLSYKSNHPMQHERGVIIDQLDRILFLSHPKYHQKNIEFMINVLLINDYLLNIIFSIINQRLKKLASRKTLYNNNIGNNDDSIDHDRKKMFTIPYMNTISD